MKKTSGIKLALLAILTWTSLAVVAPCLASVLLQISDQGNGQVQITASGSAALVQSMSSLQYLSDGFITENPWNAGLAGNPINNPNPIISGSISNTVNHQSSQVYSLRVDDDYSALDTDFIDIYWSTPLSGNIGDVFDFSFTATWTDGSGEHTSFPISAVNNFTAFNLGGDFSAKFGDNVMMSIPEPATALSLVLGGLLITGYRRFFGRV